MTEAFTETLQHLHVRNVDHPWYWEEILGALQAVLEKGNLLPNLKTLTLEGWFDMQHPDEKYEEILNAVKGVVRCARGRDIKNAVLDCIAGDWNWKHAQRGWGLNECTH